MLGGGEGGDADVVELVEVMAGGLREGDVAGARRMTEDAYLAVAGALDRAPAARRGEGRRGGATPKGRDDES